MKPRLRPQKGWRFRVMLCDEKGRVVFDDVNHPDHFASCAAKLGLELLKWWKDED